MQDLLQALVRKYCVQNPWNELVVDTCRLSSFGANCPDSDTSPKFPKVTPFPWRAAEHELSDSLIVIHAHLEHPDSACTFHGFLARPNVLLRPHANHCVAFCLFPRWPLRLAEVQKDQATAGKGVRTCTSASSNAWGQGEQCWNLMRVLLQGDGTFETGGGEFVSVVSVPSNERNWTEHVASETLWLSIYVITGVDWFV